MPDSQDETCQQEIESGYAMAAQMYGEDYANYLRANDAEHASKGLDIVPFPLSLQGNDGD